jgi:hypothetical protein
MSIELKIKSKHLSEEARIIRFEERKLLKKVDYKRKKHYAAGNNDEYLVWKDSNHDKYTSISHHRKWDVRNENRATFLARAYISGIPYNTVEQKRLDEQLFKGQIFPRICSMVVRYGKREDGDWEWDRASQKYKPTEQLKAKIAEWCNLKK